jgi:hypothetical protein
MGLACRDKACLVSDIPCPKKSLTNLLILNRIISTFTDNPEPKQLIHTPMAALGWVYWVY